MNGILTLATLALATVAAAVPTGAPLNTPAECRKLCNTPYYTSTKWGYQMCLDNCEAATPGVTKPPTPAPNPTVPHSPAFCTVTCDKMYPPVNGQKSAGWEMCYDYCTIPNTNAVLHTRQAPSDNTWAQCNAMCDTPYYTNQPWGYQMCMAECQVHPPQPNPPPPSPAQCTALCNKMYPPVNGKQAPQWEMCYDYCTVPNTN